MATLLPKGALQEITHRSEARVVRKLVESLPHDVLLIHGLNTLSRRGSGSVNPPRPDRVQQGEADVVVIWPDKGLLVIEIKGGSVAVDRETHRYIRPGSPPKPIRDPFDQARVAMHFLRDRVATRMRVAPDDLALPCNYAVVFPDCRLLSGRLPPNADPKLFRDASGMNGLRTFVANAIELGRRPFRATGVVPGTSDIRAAILPSMNLVESLCARLDDDGAEILRLSEEQIDVLEMTEDNRRVRIRGTAGTGKTLLATEQTSRFVAQGMKTLLLCYNRNLAESLRERIRERPGRQDDGELVVSTFHAFCDRVAQEAGLRPRQLLDRFGKRRYFDVEGANVVAEHAAATGHVYDAIVVDEGQDFHENWWTALACCSTGSTRHVVFYDELQDIYDRRALGCIDDFTPVRLVRNCRNTKNIAEHCGEIIEGRIATGPRSPTGVPVRRIVESDTEARRDAVLATLKAWIVEERIDPRRIAVVSSHRQDTEQCCLRGVHRIGDTRIVTNHADWKRGKGILFETAHAFKGLEADLIALVDVPARHARFDAAHFYVASSRARTLLHVFASAEWRRAA